MQPEILTLRLDRFEGARSIDGIFKRLRTSGEPIGSGAGSEVVPWGHGVTPLPETPKSLRTLTGLKYYGVPVT